MTTTDAPIAIIIAGNRHILLNAIEACELLGIPTSRCVLVISSQMLVHHSHVQEIASQREWLAVFSLIDPNSKAFADRVAIRVLSSQSRSFAWLVFSTYLYRRLFRGVLHVVKNIDIRHIIAGYYAEPIERTIHNHFLKAAYVLVDDGNLTPAVNARRKIEAENSFSNALIQNHPRKTSRLVEKIRVAISCPLAGIRKQGASQITFFSNFQFATNLPADQLIPCPKKIAASSKVDPNLVHFLGLPAFTREIFNQSNYLSILETLSAFLVGADVVYFCHPAEDDRDLEMVQSIIKPKAIVRNKMPYERVYCELDPLPSAVYGFYTSTFTGLSAIDQIKSQLVVIRVPQEMFIASNRCNTIAAIYKQLEGNKRLQILDYDQLAGRRFVNS